MQNTGRENNQEVDKVSLNDVTTDSGSEFNQTSPTFSHREADQISAFEGQMMSLNLKDKKSSKYLKGSITDLNNDQYHHKSVEFAQK